MKSTQTCVHDQTIQIFLYRAFSALFVLPGLLSSNSMKLTASFAASFLVIWFIGCMFVAFFIIGDRPRRGRHSGSSNSNIQSGSASTSNSVSASVGSSVGLSLRGARENELNSKEYVRFEQLRPAAAAASTGSHRYHLHQERTNILPPFSSPPSENSRETESSDIYLDWPLDARLFTLENYHALETLLTHHPSSRYRVMVPIMSPTTNSRVARMLPRPLHVNSFVKYARMGYDVATTPFTLDRSSVDNILSSSSSLSSLRAEEYLGFVGKNQQQMQYHYRHYMRLLKLFPTGGIFSDFSFLMLGPLSKSVVKEARNSSYLCLM
jgi:hypothetical protein